MTSETKGDYGEGGVAVRNWLASWGKLGWVKRNCSICIDDLKKRYMYGIWYYSTKNHIEYVWVAFLKMDGSWHSESQELVPNCFLSFFQPAAQVNPC